MDSVSYVGLATLPVMLATCRTPASQRHLIGLAFQLVTASRPPTRPDPAVPQQFHLDVIVEDVASASHHVLALAATKLDGENVYADPAGHPFWPRPTTAPVGSTFHWGANWCFSRCRSSVAFNNGA